RFENGTVDVDPWGWFFTRLSEIPSGMWAYGYSYKQHGMFGATPEMLFEPDGRGYQTMALAGTRPADRSSELLRDEKELREHRLVVDDIVRRVAPFGNVEVGALGILRLLSIAPLLALIRFGGVG